MFKKQVAAAIAAIALSATAHADPILLDFEGLTVGANVQNYFNGGTDSLGNSGGPNLGIYINGTVANNSFGNYLTGPVTLTFSNALMGGSSFDLKFLARNFGPNGDGSYAALIDGYAMEDQCFIDNNNFAAPDSMFGYMFNSDGTATQAIIRAGMVDDIQFIEYSGGTWAERRPADRITTYTVAASTQHASVPEPGSVLLFGVGIVAFLATRQRKTARI